MPQLDFPAFPKAISNVWNIRTLGATVMLRAASFLPLLPLTTSPYPSANHLPHTWQVTH